MKLRSMVIGGGLAAVAAAFTLLNVHANDNPYPEHLKTVDSRMSYILGNNIGRELRENRFQVDINALTEGLRDALDNREAKLNEAQIRETVIAFQQQMIQRNLDEGKKFLEENAKKEGVKVLPSGLQYKVIKSGNGASPKLDSTFVAHYRGTLIDGTEFDNSYKRGQPLTLPVRQVIPGWIEALQLMKVGDKWEIYIPADLAYGETGSGPIPPNSVLIFEMELLDVK